MHLTPAQLDQMTDDQIRAHVGPFGPGVVGEAAFRRATAVIAGTAGGVLGRGALLPHELAALEAESRVEGTEDDSDGDEENPRVLDANALLLLDAELEQLGVTRQALEAAAAAVSGPVREWRIDDGGTVTAIGATQAPTERRRGRRRAAD